MKLSTASQGMLILLKSHQCLVLCCRHFQLLWRNEKIFSLMSYWSFMRHMTEHRYVPAKTGRNLFCISSNMRVYIRKFCLVWQNLLVYKTRVAMVKLFNTTEVVTNIPNVLWQHVKQSFTNRRLITLKSYVVFIGLNLSAWTCFHFSSKRQFLGEEGGTYTFSRGSGYVMVFYG